MAVQIKTGVEFDRRLAELAWEFADDNIKTTVAHTLAMNISARSEVMGIIGEKMVEAIVEQGTKSIYDSEPVQEVIGSAKGEVADAIQADLDALKTAIAEDMADDVEKAKDRAVSSAANHAMEYLSSQIGTGQSLRGMAMRAVFNGVIEAAKERALESEVSIDNEFRYGIVAALDAMKKPDIESA